MRYFVAFGLVIWAALAVAQVSLSAVVLSGKSAYFLGTPEVIAQPTVTDMKWSSDGELLMVLREEPLAPNAILQAFSGQPVPPPSKVLSVWSRSTKKTNVLLRPGANTHVVDSVWLTRSHQLLVLQAMAGRDGSTVDLLRINADTGVSERIHRTFAPGIRPQEVNTVGATSLTVAPEAPKALLVSMDDAPKSAPGARQTIQLVGTSGAPTKSIPLDRWIGEVRWRGETPILHLTVFSSERKQLEPAWFELDPANGELVPAPMAPNMPIPKVEELRIEESSFQTPDGKTAEGLWLLAQEQSEHMKSLIALDAAQGELTSDYSAVAYVQQGHLSVRPLIKASRAVFDKMLQARAQTETMMRAKQVATALQIYAADYDDVLPPNGDLANVLNPYLKNRKVLEGFTYQGNGQHLSQMENPSQTVLGYVDGPGGRAFVYADGSVKWQSGR